MGPVARRSSELFLYRLLPGPDGDAGQALWRLVLTLAELWFMGWAALVIAAVVVAAIGPSCHVAWQPVACR